MPELVHCDDGAYVQKIKLTQERLILGRRDDNDVPLDDLSVSSQHAQIEAQPSQFEEGQLEYVIKDLGSTNGTFVNGKKIHQPQVLKHEDLVQMGLQEFKFVDVKTASYDTTRILLKEETH